MIGTSGTFRTSRTLIVLMITGGFFFVALAIAAYTDLLADDPVSRIAYGAFFLAFGLASIITGLVSSSFQIHWTPDGLTIQRTTFQGISRQTYAWSEISSIQYRRCVWRVCFADNSFFRVGLGNMRGGSAILREFGRRRISSNVDILTTLALDEKRFGKS